MHIFNAAVGYLGLFMSMLIRIILAEQLRYWGNGSFQACMDNAYKDFVSFCRIRKLDQSQPPFTTKMVLGQRTAVQVLNFDVCVLQT